MPTKKVKDVTIQMDSYSRIFLCCYFGGVLMSNELFENQVPANKKKQKDEIIKRAGTNFRKIYKACTVKERIIIRDQIAEVKHAPIRTINNWITELTSIKQKFLK